MSIASVATDPFAAPVAGAVLFYNDGPDWLTELAAERAYRDGYLAGAIETTSWPEPDCDVIEAAWEDRRRARREAEIETPQGWYVYRVGHEVAASRTRGRVQALELAKECWWELADLGMDDAQISRSVIRPWTEQVTSWHDREIQSDRISPPPRPEDFVTVAQRSMLDSMSRKQPKVSLLASNVPQPECERLSDVQREQLEWLWPGRIPLGKLTLLAGDPGLGKSFVTLDIAARVSRGGAWPDLPILKRSPAGVVLLNAEDDLADTVAPRFDLIGGDDTYVVALKGVRHLGQRRHFTLETDLPRLEEVLVLNPDTKLVIVDPISAYVGKVDSHKNSDVRGLLAPFAELASRFRVAIVAVTHLSKGTGNKAVYRAMGSLAFAAAARAVWAVVKDANDSQRRLLLPAKLNLAQDPDGMAYRIKEGRVVWEADPVRMHADDAFAAEAQAANTRPRGKERHEAKEWLSAELANGPVPSSDIIELGGEFGFSRRTLQRAYKELGGTPRKQAFDGPWLWRLGGQDANNPPSL